MDGIAYALVVQSVVIDNKVAFKLNKAVEAVDKDCYKSRFYCLGYSYDCRWN